MKKKFIIVILFFILCGFVTYIFLPNKVAVLGYHSFSKEKSTSDMVMNMDDFNKQLKFLKRYNFKSLTLDEMNCYMNKKCKIGKKTVLITMDDGYLDNYEIAFPLLKKYGFNAVVFIIGSTVDNNSEGFFNKDFIEKTKKEYPNIEFASHTYDLHYEDAINLSYEDFSNDFMLQNNIIDTRYLAYPYGHYNDDFIKALKDNKYNLAFGFGPDKEFRKADNKDNKYVIPRLSINGSMPIWKFKLRLLMPF